MLQVCCQTSGVKYKAFLWESLEFSEHSKWPNTAMKRRNGTCFPSVCAIRSENRGQSGSTESVKSKSSHLFLSMSSCSVLDVSVSVNLLDQMCFRSDACESEFSPWTSQKDFDCLTFFGVSSPYTSNLSWPGQFGLWRQTVQFDSLSSLLHLEWRGHDASGRKCSGLFIMPPEYFISVLVGQLVLMELCCVAVKSRQNFLFPNRICTEMTLSDWCGFLFIRPKCCARHWINRRRCCVGGSLLSVI